MTIARCQLVMPYFSGLPEDVVTNTFHFENLVTATMQEMADDITPLLSAFWVQIYGTAPNNPSNYLQASSTWHTNWYDLADAPPRPVYTLPLGGTFSTAIASTLPPEAAAVLSFQGDPAAGVPQARRRGRIYLGALNATMAQSGTSTFLPRLDATWVNKVAAQAEVFRAAVATAGHRWIVWSPTNSNAVLITNGWVDNAFDTQRRRGGPATIRTAFP